MNGRVGNTPLDGVMGSHGEATLNQNGKTLIEFCSYNKLKICNTFFPHRDIHKYTWAARGSRSIIDYVLTNEKLFKIVHDTRVYRGKDIQSDHFLLITKIAVPARWRKLVRTNLTPINVFKVNLLQDDSIRRLYQMRLNQYMTYSAVGRNINNEWEEIKNIIYQTALEVLGTRKKKLNNKSLCWNEEIKQLIKEKKEAYLNFLSNRTDVNRTEYKYRCALVRKAVRKHKRNSWEKYVADLEHDVWGRQEKAYKILKYLNNEEKDNLQLNCIKEQEWLQYFGNL